MQVGQVTAVAWPRQLDLAIQLAEQADRPADWPGLGRVSPGPLQLVVVPDARRLDSLTGGRAPRWGAAIALPTTRTIVIYCEPWVTPMEHPFVVLARREGRGTEHAAPSVLLRIAGGKE